MSDEKDLYLHMIDSTGEKLDVLCDEIRGIKGLLMDMKVDQTKCNSRWEVLSKIGTLLASGGLLMVIVKGIFH